MRIASQTPCSGNSLPLPLPQRMEIEAVTRILNAFRMDNKACLDLGFDPPRARLLLRGLGGYWTAVSRNAAERNAPAESLDEAVERLGAQGELPFEDKQFDVAVLAHGSLSGNPRDDEALIRELHRVLKVGGLIALTVEHAKPLSLASLLNQRRTVSHAGGRFSENDVFNLLRDGFDVLGIRHYCRFWVQWVRQWADRRTLAGDRAAGGDNRLNVLYGLAHLLDLPLRLGKGHLMTAYGRRKGWRPRHTPTLADGRRLSDVVLKGSGPR